MKKIIAVASLALILLTNIAEAEDISTSTVTTAVGVSSVNISGMGAVYNLWMQFFHF
ncbi:hypothetical protein [Pelodictyon luteolum]|uniref:hypothetical protein n=1 Tax=Pelodictyon luteolum TaxID=1100 RepID=UPI0003005170|nr:hypothetical protein [Pelodictyon luteolum]